MSIGDTDFDPDEFIIFEQKVESIKEYAIYKQLYDDHYRLLTDIYKPWVYENDFVTVCPAKDIRDCCMYVRLMIKGINMVLLSTRF